MRRMVLCFSLLVCANLASAETPFQFGFLNIAENGFLPVFPIFNFPES